MEETPFLFSLALTSPSFTYQRPHTKPLATENILRQPKKMSNQATSSYCPNGGRPHELAIGQTELPIVRDSLSPIKLARPRHPRIPRHDSNSYQEYKERRDRALELAVRERERELALRSQVECVHLDRETLTVRYNSQSKLSQQELADLQKATHFDKKELQQWYKGETLFFSLVGIGVTRDKRTKPTLHLPPQKYRWFKLD